MKRFAFAYHCIDSDIVLKEIEAEDKFSAAKKGILSLCTSERNLEYMTRFQELEQYPSTYEDLVKYLDNLDIAMSVIELESDVDRMRRVEKEFEDAFAKELKVFKENNNFTDVFWSKCPIDNDYLYFINPFDDSDEELNDKLILFQAKLNHKFPLKSIIHYPNYFNNWQHKV